MSFAERRVITMKTTQWLQISDIHILKNDPEWIAFQRSLFDYLDNNGITPDFLVLTGDYHNISEPEFTNAVLFINEVCRHFSLSLEKDIFLVPGNHDTAPQIKPKLFWRLFWRLKAGFGEDPRKFELLKLLPEGLNPWDTTKDKDDVQMWLEKHKNSPVNYIDRLCGISRRTNADSDIVNINILLEGFSAYREFVMNLFRWYHLTGTNPAVPHFRKWINDEGIGFNIVHINTAIVADGSRSHYQALDLQATTSLLSKLEKNGLPTFVIAHNSFYDLHPKIQNELIIPLAQASVCAWMCGDAHRFSTEKFILIPESKGQRKVPIFVCGKGAPDNMDTWSNYGFFHYSLEGTVVNAHLVKWDAQHGCRTSSLSTSSFPTVVKQPASQKSRLLIGYLSCNPDIPLRDKYHLGHALFISNMDEKIAYDKSVLLISSFVRPNRGEGDQTGSERAYVANMMEHWKQCFQEKVSVLDITQAFGADRLDDDNGNKMVGYLSQMEMKLACVPNAQKIQEIISDWARGDCVSEYNLALIKDFLEVDHSKTYSVDEIMSFAFMLYKKPTWYSITWLRAFLYFWNYRLIAMLHSSTGFDVSGQDIYIYEARRNHYVWDAISYCAKKFDYPLFPQVEYFDSLLDTKCLKPMKASSDTAFYLKDFEEGDRLSDEFKTHVKRMFRTEKSLEEIAKHYYLRLGLDKD